MFNRLKWFFTYNRFSRRVRSLLKIGEYCAAWGVTPYDVANIINRAGIYNIYKITVDAESEEYFNSGQMTVIYFNPYSGDDHDEYWLE